MRILFLCVSNAARSQMAEGLARALLPASVTVESAGSEPGTLNPDAVAVMAEIGIDISKHQPKGLDAVDVAGADVIVTLCADEICPVVPGAVKRLHWPISDPVDVESSRAARAQIQDRIEALSRVLT
ncbi:MAG: arsenate reductase ArsC [Gammaproteobacteria bacterium]|nr:MAG: arsenate reductase ArsC [Gammaproteobacteria bacterium]